MVITDKLEKSTLEEKIHLKVSESDEQALKRVKDRFDDMKKGRSEQEALRDYKKAIEINQDFEDIYYYAGFSYYLLDKYYDAIEYFTKALEINMQIYK